MLPRIEARGRTNYIATEWASVNNSFLDTRFARAKSPRSRQYLIRDSKIIMLNAEMRLGKVLAYRSLQMIRANQFRTNNFK